MLRFWVRIGFWLTAGFAVIGALVARQWGWSEYTLAELYLIYNQRSTPTNASASYVVRADASDSGQILMWEGHTPKEMVCSPDGSKFAFLTDTDHLYVMAATGLLYDQVADNIYDYFDVANNGAVTFQELDGNYSMVNPTGIVTIHRPVMDADTKFFRFHISSHGLALWTIDPGDMIIASATDGTIIRVVPEAAWVEWLGDEQTIIYLDPFSPFRDRDPHYEHYLMDVTTQNIFRLNDPNVYSVYSPNGMYAAKGSPFDPNAHNEIAIFDPLTNRPIQQLAKNPYQVYQVLCFLTFRPQMLLANSQ